MTNKIEISRELAERLTNKYRCTVSQLEIHKKDIEELRALLADHPEEPLAMVTAPVVERQPVAWIGTDMNGDSYLTYDKQTPSDKPLYAERPAPVAWDRPDQALLDRHEAWMAGVENGRSEAMATRS